MCKQQTRRGCLLDESKEKRSQRWVLRRRLGGILDHERPSTQWQNTVTAARAERWVVDGFVFLRSSSLEAGQTKANVCKYTMTIGSRTIHLPRWLSWQPGFRQERQNGEEKNRKTALWDVGLDDCCFVYAGQSKISMVLAGMAGANLSTGTNLVLIRGVMRKEFRITLNLTQTRELKRRGPPGPGACAPRPSARVKCDHWLSLSLSLSLSLVSLSRLSLSLSLSFVSLPLSSLSDQLIDSLCLFSLRLSVCLYVCIETSNLKQHC